MSWVEMTMGLLGGLALFLFGMDQLATSLKAVASTQVKALLGRLTTNRVTGAIAGAFVTAVIQSSSVTTVLAVGFVSAGLMTLAQSIGIIMGANVGTTVTAQIVAFDVSEAAMAIIAVGFAMRFFLRSDAGALYGALVMGLGLVFFGMEVMSEAMGPLRTYQPFIDLMARTANPVLGVIFGALFTALLQSSSATTGIVVVMATQGFITLPAGIALALGANIGTCATALLAAIGKPTEAVRAALVHVVFNVAGVLLWFGLLTELSTAAVALSPAHPELSGVERLAAETPRQIANANTLFNVVNTLFFLPFAGLLARLVTRLVPSRPDRPDRALVEPKFLDTALVSTPVLALERVRLELGHMGEIVVAMLTRFGESTTQRERAGATLDAIARMDDEVDILYERILDYLQQIRRQELTDDQSREFLQLMSATDILESIGEVVETDLSVLVRRILDADLRASDKMQAALAGLASDVTRAVEAATRSVRDRDTSAAREVVGLKSRINQRITEVIEHQASKLALVDPRRVAIFRVEMGIVENVKRIYTLAKRIAKLELPKELRDRAA